MTLWLGLALLMSLGALLTTHFDNWPFALGASGMFLAGVALVAFGKWLSRNDMAWLSEVIRGPLGHRPLDGSAGLPRSESSGPPLVLRIMAFVLAFMGA